MEALTDQPVAYPGLHQRVLGVLGAVNTWASDPARDALTALVEACDEDEVAALPRSIGVVLPLFLGDPERLKVALDAILRFDLFEAVDGLAVLVWQGHDVATLAASALAAHPGISSSVRDLVASHGADLESASDVDLFRTRLSFSYTPTTAPARLDREVRWPSADPASSRLAVAAVQPASRVFSARDQLRLVIDLVASGAAVRRLPSAGLRKADAWLPEWVPVIGPNASLAKLRVASPLTISRRRQVVDQVFAAQPGKWRQRQAFAPFERLQPLEVDTVAAFDEGALPRREVAYLSGLKAGQFGGLREYQSLVPRQFRGLNYWRFGQLVALRAANYLFHLSGRRRGLYQVADTLARVAQERQEFPVGITTKGSVLINDSGDVYDVETGQVVDEGIIHLVDQVYEPFVLQSGQVPRLLRPAEHVVVNPSIVRGLPCVSETRITVGAVASVVAAAQRSGRPDAYLAAEETFGLNAGQVQDALRVSNAIQAV